MWVIAMFDIPVTTPSDRRSASQFRKLLLDDGFFMLQYSIYGRPCSCEAHAKLHRDTIRAHLPANGQVRIITITERQFSTMENYVGKLPKTPENNNEQLFIF